MVSEVSVHGCCSPCSSGSVARHIMVEVHGEASCQLMAAGSKEAGDQVINTWAFGKI